MSIQGRVRQWHNITSEIIISLPSPHCPSRLSPYPSVDSTVSKHNLVSDFIHIFTMTLSGSLLNFFCGIWVKIQTFLQENLLEHTVAMKICLWPVCKLQYMCYRSSWLITVAGLLWHIRLNPCLPTVNNAPLHWKYLTAQCWVLTPPQRATSRGNMVCELA